MKKILTAQEHLNELKAEADEKLEQGGTFLETTRPENVYGWSVAKHQAMQKLADYYRRKGYEVSRNVRWGTTDWEISPPLTIPS